MAPSETPDPELTSTQTDEGSEGTVSVSDFKAMQRNLAKREAQMRALLIEKAQRDTVASTVERLERHIETLTEKIAAAELIEGDDIKTLASTQKSERAAAGAANTAYTDLAGSLQELGVEDWATDPKIASVRDAWNRKDYVGAAAIAKALVAVKGASNGTDAKDKEEDVAAKANDTKAALAKVDKGSSTSAGNGAIPTSNPRLLAEKLRDPEWRAANLGEVMKLAKAGKVKLSNLPS